MKNLFALLSALVFAVVLPGADIARNSGPIPTEIGMYAKNANGDWKEIEPEIINWKTGGVLKSALTRDIIKRDVNGRIRGGAAFTSAGFEDEFLVVVPEGISITEFQMLHLHEHRNSREFRLVTGGIFHQSGGADRDEQDFDHQKIAPRTYLVSFHSYEGGGEFGFMPPPSSALSPVYMGKIYCLRMKN
ncbi:MAG TPA: hypothetical protein VHZ55_08100 [Bryobacteraceae bacterium]|nr:hypothetical protein [Bryobacteraceae bacterium]